MNAWLMQRTANELYDMMGRNYAEWQMDKEQYQALYSLIESGDITTYGQLSEYMKINIGTVN